jgi:hypothetical protein
MSACIELDDLVLRVPGLSQVEAQALGEQVARGVAERLSGASLGHAGCELGGLELRVQADALATGAGQRALAARLVEQIVTAILARLR